MEFSKKNYSKSLWARTSAVQMFDEKSVQKKKKFFFKQCQPLQRTYNNRRSTYWNTFQPYANDKALENIRKELFPLGTIRDSINRRKTMQENIYETYLPNYYRNLPLNALGRFTELSSLSAARPSKIRVKTSFIVKKKVGKKKKITIKCFIKARVGVT